MPHAIPANAIIQKTDGTFTGPMSQKTTETYLENVIKTQKNRHANLKQALNDVFGGKGKPTGAYRQAGQPVLHASSGNGEKSVTLFFYLSGGNAIIFAMGEHLTSDTYKVSDYGQPTGSFTYNATITL